MSDSIGVSIVRMQFRRMLYHINHEEPETIIVTSIATPDLVGLRRFRGSDLDVAGLRFRELSRLRFRV